MTTLLPTGHWATRSSRRYRRLCSERARTAHSSAARCATWPAEAGIRQFLDIGTGIPTADNTHEVAQAIAPDSRALYVDNDPIVLAHARALMTSTPVGSTAFIHADLRDPDKILNDPKLRATLDLGRPVALMLIAVLHFLTEEDNPQGIVRRLLDALPSGSYLTITHLTANFVSPEEAAVAEAAARTPASHTPRAAGPRSRSSSLAWTSWTRA